MRTRRDLIASLGVAASASLAGCSTDSIDSDENATDTAATDEGSSNIGAKTAVAAQWNVYRARLFDAVALGRAGQSSDGAAVAQSILAQFEGAAGEYGAYEMLEKTSDSAYEGFEEALATVESSLTDGDVDTAADAAAKAAGQLQVAQQVAAGNTITRALDILWLAGRGANAAFLAAAGELQAANAVASETYEDFEDAPVHATLEETDHDIYETFEHGLEDAASAAKNGDAGAVREHVHVALGAGVDGAYAITEADAAGAGHLAAMQARGYDAAALAGLGGSREPLAHAAALNVYRARVHDAHWLASEGGTDAAVTMANDVFAHFEDAKAHGALEHADHDAYEGFEGGLDDLAGAIENGDASGVDDAVDTVDSNLVTGIGVLAGGNASVVQCGFFRARLGDARELYELGNASAAVAVVEDLLERFEADELGFHESLEHASEELYERFEHEHLPALKTGFEDGDDDAVQTHYDGAQGALVEYEATQSEALASGAETSFMLGRGFDAAAVTTLGNADRAAAIATDAFEHFEDGAAGYHEALEHADHGAYESFEGKLGSVRSAAKNGGDVYAAAKAFNDQGLAGLYVIAANAGGDGTEAADIARSIFQTFEAADVHETLEEADHDAYETFEHALEEYASALESGDVDPAPFANAARAAQFAVVGAAEKAPEADDQ